MGKSSFEQHHDQHLRSLLEPGESLLGVCAASQQRGMFSGGAVALAATERRLIVQPLDRRGRAEGEASSIRPEELSSAEADGAGGGWAGISAALMDRAAVKLERAGT